MDPEKIENLLSKQIASMQAANGLKSLKTSNGHLMSPGGPPDYSKVLESSWDSLENFMDWVQSQKPEDNADKDFMLESGVALLFYEVTEL
jgi:hypothetical protein